MNLTTLKTTLLSATLTVGFALIVSAEDEHEEKIALSAAPAAVQAAIQANLAGGTVMEIEKETKNGVIVYEVKVVGIDKTKTEYKIAADGSLIKAEAKKAKASEDEVD